MNSFYRIVRSSDNKVWTDTGYGPYSHIATARNVASGQFGGYWRGKNSDTVKRTRYDYVSKSHVSYVEFLKIQKLTPVLKPFENGFPALILALEWVDVDAG